MQKQVLTLDQISEEDRRTIDRQVERLLVHPLFRLSKRLPAFLSYVVHESLAHSEDGPPKERTLGVEVFGRKPDYDTNADPIVRVTATELRKKLAQYYYADGQDDEIRIELPPGSYLPRFHRSVERHSVEPAGETHTFPILPTPVVPKAAMPRVSAPEERRDPILDSQPVTAKSASNRWMMAAILLAMLLLATLLGYIPLLHRGTASKIEHFWSSFAGTANTVTVVMPVIGTDWVSSAARPSDVSVAPNLSLEDTNIASRVAGQLEKENLHYVILPAPEINFGGLRSGPAVLIGALDNVWTLRLSKDLPFTFEESPDGRTGSIVETKPVANSKARKWSVDITTPHQRIGQDFGIVARFKSQLTGQPVMVIAGISSQGTQAAGEIVTVPVTLEGVFAKIHNADNFEIVIETTAVDGRAGPPQVVASRTW